MNASELKYRVESAGHGSYFFARASMRFAGDTMRNYGVRPKPVEILTYSGEKVKAWVLYRKRPVKLGLSSNAYFCTESYRRVVPNTGE